jgi:isopentenyl-diphosphate Delta-isomerase
MTVTEEQVVLVDEQDAVLGTMGKWEAHRNGSLHRAFSVFIFSTKGELLMQRRAAGKYHSGGSWSNTCCGHPRPGEDVLAAAGRRLGEEMGLSCALHYKFTFRYRADVGAGLVENELDHVFFGLTDDAPDVDPEEAGGWRMIAMDALASELEHSPEHFTPWLHACFEQVRQQVQDAAL